MIPKVIHYCWFGNNPKNKDIEKCMASWKKFCPDYEIIEWNESNFDINCIPFVKQAYDAKKWAFVTDYARLKIIYENGGIYLDTDVELLKPLDELLTLDAYVGLQSAEYINTGLGFGAVKGNQLIYDVMNDYNERCFSDENCQKLACPIINTEIFTENGFIHENKLQVVNGVTILPIEYLNPMDSETYIIHLTDKTYSIHHYSTSWKNGNSKLIHFVVKLCCLILGEKRAMKLKEKIKKR